MGFFKKKQQKELKSEEYLDLMKDISALRIQITELKLKTELYIKKIRLKKGLETPKEDEKINKVLLPEP